MAPNEPVIRTKSTKIQCRKDNALFVSREQKAIAEKNKEETRTNFREKIK